MEQFNVCYHAKEYDELMKSIQLHTKYTGGLLIFDFSTYFSVMGQGSFNTYPAFKNDHILMEYSKYLQSGYRELNSFESDSKQLQLKVIATDSEDYTQALKEASFELIDSKGKSLATLTTDTNGQAVFAFPKRLLGSYTLVQKTTSRHYQINASPLHFTLGNESVYDINDSTYTYVIRIANDKGKAAGWAWWQWTILIVLAASAAVCLVWFIHKHKRHASLAKTMSLT